MLRRISSKQRHSTDEGRHYEYIAEQFLRRNGHEPIARNVSSRGGEIDLVMQDDKTVVFVEVRYRKNADFGAAVESVTSAKQHRIAKTAAVFLQKHPKYQQLDARFDVVGIVGPSLADEDPQIEWIKGAFYV